MNGPMTSTLAWTFSGSWQPREVAHPRRQPVATASHPNVTRAEGVVGELNEVSALDERSLVEACLSGRSGAFDLIVERHRRSVYQLCYRFVGNHEDASDLSQDVFLRAYRGLRNFRGQSTLSTWLYRIGVNVCLNRVSAKTVASEPLGDHQPVDAHAELPSERILKDERGKRVRAAIARLPRKQRATLILRMYHEMSHQEIADVLGSSVGAVKANFFHALGNLKRLLEESGQG
jgi:RNA polymerase sigma-70 factor (ECF subfamily)